jgi:hypothetical protein
MRLTTAGLTALEERLRQDPAGARVRGRLDACRLLVGALARRTEAAWGEAALRQPGVSAPDRLRQQAVHALEEVLEALASLDKEAPGAGETTR